MKKLFALCLSLLLIATLVTPAYAAEEQPISRQVTETEDGITIIDELFDVSTARSTDKAYARRKTYTRDGVTIGIITLTATFRYDGSTVSVVSKAVTQSDTYDGWSYSTTSLTASGGTATLSGKLTKLLVVNVPVSISITCDANGNIT